MFVTGQKYLVQMSPNAWLYDPYPFNPFITSLIIYLFKLASILILNE